MYISPGPATYQFPRSLWPLLNCFHPPLPPSERKLLLSGPCELDESSLAFSFASRNHTIYNHERSGC